MMTRVDSVFDGTCGPIFDGCHLYITIDSAIYKGDRK